MMAEPTPTEAFVSETKQTTLYEKEKKTDYSKMGRALAAADLHEQANALVTAWQTPHQLEASAIGVWLRAGGTESAGTPFCRAFLLVSKDRCSRILFQTPPDHAWDTSGDTEGQIMITLIQRTIQANATSIFSCGACNTILNSSSTNGELQTGAIRRFGNYVFGVLSCRTTRSPKCAVDVERRLTSILMCESRPHIAALPPPPPPRSSQSSSLDPPSDPASVANSASASVPMMTIPCSEGDVLPSSLLPAGETTTVATPHA